jgi:hypothetical protein
LEKVDATFLIQRDPKRRCYVISNEIPENPHKIEFHHSIESLASEFHFSVALFARPYLFVHAGVVAWHGRAIVIPGRSMNGKSTMVAALVKHGATYYSDEYAVVDGRGRIHPYRKSLALRIQEGAECAYQFTPPPRLDGKGKPLTACVVAFLKYVIDARWRPRKLTPGEAVLSLLDNTVLAQRRARFALRALSALARRGTAIRTLRPDIALAAPAILDLASKVVSSEHTSTD